MNIKGGVNMITTENIIQVIKELSQNEKPYLSEAQFQFELAWKLQENKELYNIDKILLEYTACAEKATKEKKKKRFESDIIVLFQNGTYIAFELKYKTSKAVINGVNLIQQAGQPGTKYDYLWDIHRIELLMNKDENTDKYEYYMDNKKCIGGYAIFLTNDASYWGESKENKSAYNFCLCDGTIQKGELKWNVGDGELKDWMKPRTPFVLLGEYKMKWETFMPYTYKNKPKEFKYLITTIKQS